MVWQNAVVETVLPQVMRAMTASTVDAVSGRVERATSGAAPANALFFGGASMLGHAVMANSPAFADGTWLLSTNWILPRRHAALRGGTVWQNN